MFTGLVERTGIVEGVTKPNHLATVCSLLITPGDNFEREHGASVAVNGVCLTEVGVVSQGRLTFHVSPETLNKTSLGELKAGDLVNLERAMRPTDRLGGHIMLGHVDGTGRITEVTAQQGFWFVEVEVGRALSRYVVSKGSIAVDGVSLTVNALRDDGDLTFLSFMLIPVTWTTTRFHKLSVGSLVNIEVDVLAKHIERLLSPWQGSSK